MIARLKSSMASFFTFSFKKRHAPLQRKRRFFLGGTLRSFVGAFASLFVARSIFHPTTLLATSRSPFAIRPVGDGIYLHEGKHERPSPANGGDIANMIFVVGDERVLVFDSGYAPYLGSALKAAVASVTDKPIAYVVNSHIHPDHMFGNAPLDQQGVTFVGHHGLPTAFERVGPYYLRGLAENIGSIAAQGARLIAPSILVNDKPTLLDLGGRTVRIEAWQPAHTYADVTAFDDKSGLLMTGDLVFDEHVPTFDGSTLGWISVLEVLRAYDCRGIIPGHGKAYTSDGWTQPIDAMLTYLNTVVKDVRALIARNATIDEAVMQAGQSQKDAWALFDHYHPGNVTFAFAELEWE